MAPFAKMSIWPVGYFRAFSSWILRNRRDVSARIAVINAEALRIGQVTVFYRAAETVEGGVKVSENRMGFSVTPGSSLEALLRAYIARGGNPLDISSFMMPDRTETLEDGAEREEFPGSGVAAPRSAEYHNPVDETDDTGYGSYRGGYIPLDGYYPARQGGRKDRGGWEDDAIVRTMHQIRGWANQEIKEVQNLAWRIVKLVDLREQLLKERDEILVQAFGGALTILDDEFDEKLVVRSHQVQNMVQDMYDILYQPLDTGVTEGTTEAFTTRGDIGFLDFTFADKTSEIRDPLGG